MYRKVLSSAAADKSDLSYGSKIIWATGGNKCIEYTCIDCRKGDPAGRHHLSVEIDGYRTCSQDCEVKLIVIIAEV